MAASKIRPAVRTLEPVWVMEGAGVRLKRTIASPALDYLDPFLLLDHFGSDDPDDYLAGFPMHPHRGIETVTYMLAGRVAHKDTMGNAGTIHAGDVQWMTSGGGLMHEEMPQPVKGVMGGFQLWVNLPARLKMSQPRYQEIPAATIPLQKLDNGITARVIAGTLNHVRGPVTEIAADPLYMDITVPPDAVFTLPVPRGHTLFTYIFEGAAVFDPSAAPVPAPCLVIFGDGDQVRITAGNKGGRFILAAGKPLGEPIARYGPFVMNTRAEIQQALRDLQNGTFVWQP